MKLATFFVTLCWFLFSVQSQDTGFGACFLESSDCGDADVEADTLFQDCLCMGGLSYGFEQEGERHCAVINQRADGSRALVQADSGHRKLGVWGDVWDGFVDGLKWCAKRLYLYSEDDVNYIGIGIPFRRAQMRGRDLQDEEEELEEVCYDLDMCHGDMEGEPHIKQLSGGWFDYQGECDLVFSHVPDYAGGLGLDIHARTTIRYTYSYISSAAIKLGDDVLEVMGFGGYVLNGIESADLNAEGATLSGYRIAHNQINGMQHSFEIDIGAGYGIIVHTMKDIVSVKLNTGMGLSGKTSWFRNSTGLMGSFGSNEKIARDGVTILDDPNDFGQEWQVRDSDPKLFQNPDRPPQYPAKCILPEPASEESRRLGDSISLEAAEKACEKWNEDKERCIYDVMATGDLELALAGAY